MAPKPFKRDLEAGGSRNNFTARLLFISRGIRVTFAFNQGRQID